RAGDRTVHRADYTAAFKVQIRGGDAAGRRQRCQSRGGKPLVGALHDRVFALPLVGKEGEDLVFPDGAAYAAAELVIAVGVSTQAAILGSAVCWVAAGGHGRGAVPALVGIQARARDLGKEAAVDGVCSALRR